MAIRTGFGFLQQESVKKIVDSAIKKKLISDSRFQNWPKFGRIPDPGFGFGLPTLVGKMNKQTDWQTLTDGQRVQGVIPLFSVLHQGRLG